MQVTWAFCSQRNAYLFKPTKGLITCYKHLASSTSHDPPWLLVHCLTLGVCLPCHFKCFTAAGSILHLIAPLSCTVNCQSCSVVSKSKFLLAKPSPSKFWQIKVHRHNFVFIYYNWDQLLHNGSHIVGLSTC